MKENTVSLEFLFYSFKKGNKDCYLQETNNLAERHDMVELLSSDLLLVFPDRFLTMVAILCNSNQNETFQNQFVS